MKQLIMRRYKIRLTLLKTSNGKELIYPALKIAIGLTDKKPNSNIWAVKLYSIRNLIIK